MASMEYTLLNKLTAKPGKRDRVVEILLESGRLFEGNEACLLYLVTAAEDDPNVVWVVDLWTSQDAHAEALKDPALRPFVDDAMQVLAGPPEQIEVTSMGYVGTLGASLRS
jgi:quinol monooxygenase YgiN